MQDGFELALCVFVQERDGDFGFLVRWRAGNTKGVVIAAASECETEVGAEDGVERYRVVSFVDDVQTAELGEGVFTLSRGSTLKYHILSLAEG